MDVVHERCCGVDVHKATVVACLIVPGPTGRPSKEIRTFGTMTVDLLALADWPWSRLACTGNPCITFLKACWKYWS